MKAALFYGPFDIRTEDTAKPAAGRGQAVVKIKAVGICGSDLHFYDGTHPYQNYPRIYGHEMAGIVDETGEGVTGFKRGDRVAIEPLLPCGHCYACRVGKYNCCANLKVIGAHTDGGFAEYLSVPADRLNKIPDDMDFVTASLCEPYTIGAHCMERAAITKEDTVLILGAGAIGLTILDYAKNANARVIVADIHQFRLDKAKSFGADVVINSKQEDLLSRIMELTGNEGASVVIEATGVSKVMESTQDLVAAGGRIVIVGLTTEKVAFTGINFTKKEMTILGSRNSTNMFPYVIKMFSSGKLQQDKLITRVFDFSEIKEAFEYTYNNLSVITKVVIQFSD